MKNLVIKIDCETNKSNKNTFIGNSDPTFLFGKDVDQRLKGTLGITG